MYLAKGIGNSSMNDEIDRLSQLKFDVNPINIQEFRDRIQTAKVIMIDNGIDAVYLHAKTNLYYFTGMKWNPSERMVGCILTASGELHYIAPKFEKGTILDFMQLEGEIHVWEEHESPYVLFYKILSRLGMTKGRIGLDETTPFFISNGLALLNPIYEIIDAKIVSSGCRMHKSAHEILIMQTAMNITLEVQKSAGAVLHEGISSQEMITFIDRCHQACGISSGSYFCIVLFGVDSSFPHGVRQAKDLEIGEVVLIDTGCQLHGYISDITRSYVFGEATDEQRKIWNIEKQVQQAAFDAAVIGRPCSDIDDAARTALLAHGLGPDYQLPGTPHRTGHGIGLDIHEWPYIVRDNDTLLAAGMTFSNEPMICVPDQFGIRLEDHIYMDEKGAQWFTEPSSSVQNPFNL